MLSEDDILEYIARIKEDLREQAISISKVSGIEKRRKIVLKSSAFANSVTQLENHGNQYGFSANEIDHIVSVVTLPYLEIAVKKRILSSLNPREKVNPEAVISLISALSSATVDMKKLILKWLCLTYPYSSDITKITYTKLYGCIFYYLDDEDLLPYTCHLLYIITTRRAVKPFRSRRLLEIYQHGTKTGQIIKPLYILLQLYSQYDPSILLPLPPKTNIGYAQFQHVDDSWNEVISLLHQVNQNETIESSSILLDRKKYIDFRMNSQLFFQTNYSLSLQESKFQWPHSYSILKDESNDTHVTLEQINTPNEVAFCLTENRFQLTVPDQSLAFLAPAVFSNALYILKWSDKVHSKRKRILALLPNVLSSLIFGSLLSDYEKQQLIKQVDQLLTVLNDIPPSLTKAIEEIVRKTGIWNKEVIMLLRFLPDTQLMDFVPFMKEAYHKSSINQRSVCLAGIVDCCLRLRTRMKYDGNVILLRLQIFEGLLESCMMMSLFDQPSIFLQSIYCEYLLMQMSIPSNYLYMPHDTILQLLLLSHNAILINAVCLFAQLLKMVTQSGSHQDLLPAVNRLEEILKIKYSTTSLQYSSSFGYFYAHMLEKEKQQNRSTEIDVPERFKKCLQRYHLIGLLRFIQ